MRDIVLNNEYIKGPQLWVNSRLLTGVSRVVFGGKSRRAERRENRYRRAEEADVGGESLQHLPGEGGPPGTRKDGWTQWTQGDVDARTGALKAVTPH